MPTDRRIARALSLLDIGRPAEALETAGRILATDPDSVVAWLVTARSCGALGDREGQLTAAKKVIELKPASHTGHRELAIALAGSGRYDEALPHARRAVHLAPEKASTYCTLAAILVNKPYGPSRGAHLAEARVAAERARTVAPDLAEPHYIAGVVALYSGRWNDAEQALRRAVAIDPGHSSALNALGVMAKHRRDPTEAANLFGASLAADPARPGKARANLASLTGTFITRASWIALVWAAVAVPLAQPDTTGAAFWAPWALRLALAGCALTVLARTWRRLRPPVRRYLLYYGRRNFRLAVRLTFVTVTLLAVAVGALLPVPFATAFVGVACPLAVVARVVDMLLGR